MAQLWPGLGGPSINYISEAPSESWQQTWPRSLVLLGSTGSIGRSTLAVAAAHPQLFRMVGFACARNVQRLAEQALEWRPLHLAVLDEESAASLRALLPADYRPRILVGSNGYAELASLPEASTVLSAQVGAAGLAGTLAAALAGKVICLANKESLVLAGDLLRPQVLLDRDRVVRATFHRRVVGDDHAFAARHPADAGDHAGARAFVVVHATRGQRRDLQERTAGVEEPVDPVARQQLAATDVALAGAPGSAQGSDGQPVLQIGHQRQVLLAMRYPLGNARRHRRSISLELMANNRTRC